MAKSRSNVDGIMRGFRVEAKSARMGRAYRSRENLYSDKIAIWEKKFVRFLSKPQAL